jgi:hypothetical protein
MTAQNTGTAVEAAQPKTTSEDVKREIRATDLMRDAARTVCAGFRASTLHC